MAEQFRIESPDFARILTGDDRAVHNAIRLLWLTANTAFERIDRRRLVWQEVPFAAGNFTASAGTWTVASGDVSLYRFIFADRMMLIEFAFVNTTTSSGMGTDLYIPMPLNLSAQNALNTGFCITAGTITEVDYISTRSGANATSLALLRTAGTSWPSSVTDNLDIRGAVVVEI
jgi:hypothetical protein